MKILTLIIFASILAFAATSTRAFCVCVDASESTSVAAQIVNAKNGATAVFLGKVSRFEYVSGLLKDQRSNPPALNWETKVAYFKIERWWKMATADDEVFLITDEIRMADGSGRHSSCDFYFRVGESYLVFANGSEGRLSTHACTLTGPESSRKLYVEALGEGNPPIKKFEAEKPKVSSFGRRFLLSEFGL